MKLTQNAKDGSGELINKSIDADTHYDLNIIDYTLITLNRDFNIDSNIIKSFALIRDKSIFLNSKLNFCKVQKIVIVIHLI